VPFGSEVVKIKAVIAGNYEFYEKSWGETWHAVDRFTMTIGKHENDKLLPDIMAYHVFSATSEFDNPLVSSAMTPN